MSNGKDVITEIRDRMVDLVNKIVVELGNATWTVVTPDAVISILQDKYGDVKPVDSLLCAYEITCYFGEESRAYYLVPVIWHEDIYLGISSENQCDIAKVDFQDNNQIDLLGFEKGGYHVCSAVWERKEA